MPRSVRLFTFNPWAGKPEPAEAWLARLPDFDLRALVSDPSDAKLMRMGRLDCDWHGESTRCFATLSHPELTFLPSYVFGRTGYVELPSIPCSASEERWLVIYGQHPKSLETLAGKVFGALKQRGFRIFYYAFDEATRTMPCFPEIAPHLDVLIHDEAPLAPASAARLSPKCLRLHRSWVANLLPYSAPFVENPEKKIVFLGSEMGLTPHRKRQVEFLRTHFGDTFIAIHDHSLSVADRCSLSRYKVSVCPEGRKFGVPTMRASHTDRPFWSGCLGLMPVSENSREGGRLEALHREKLILRYPHGNLKALAACCEQALDSTAEERRRCYEHFNRNETVGTVVASLIGQAASRPSPK